jgi:predicted nuclease with TOPRIM domain
MSMNMTRQDIVSATESAKNKIIERLVTRYDVQYAADQARDRMISNMNALHVELMGTLRNTSAQYDQSHRRIQELENRIASMQQDIRALTQSVQRLSADAK